MVNNPFSNHSKSICWSNKNGISANEVSMGSNVKYLFDCDVCAHEFSMYPKQIIIGTWCPFCAGRKLCDNNDCIECFKRSFASHEKAQYFSVKNNISARKLSLSSHTKCWFDCNECKHEFETKLNNVSCGYWCPYCANRKLCDNDECNYCYNMSLASCILAIYWSDKNNVSARQIFKNSTKKIWFDCIKCGHDFESKPSDIKSKNLPCPYCGRQKLCNNEECNTCYDNSFASHIFSKFWSDKNNITPRQAFKHSDEKYLFECDKCNHEFERCPRGIDKNLQCPYCSHIAKKLCDNNECITCYERSFASHEFSKKWSDRNVANPRQVFKCSDIKYWFKCNDCNNDFESKPCKIIHSHYGCPICVNKTEHKLYNILIKIYSNIVRAKKFDWCIGNKKKHYPFDFFLPDQNLIIELDGRQHFNDMKCWKNVAADQRSRDVYKMIKANENGYNMIRLLQTDVLMDKNNWEQLLETAINNLNPMYTFGKVINQYIAIDDIYNEHIFDMYMLNSNIKNYTVGKHH